MTSITAGLDQLIGQMVDTDRRMARRTGKHLDRMQKGLAELHPQSQHLALPPSTAADFQKFNDADIKKLLKAYGVKGYTSRKGYRLKKADRIALAVEHGVPALSFDFLLGFYLQSI